MFPDGVRCASDIESTILTRVRLYYQSSHLGDEFILRNPDFNRINLSFEEIEALLSLDVKWARIYGGGGYLIHREPALDRSRAQWDWNCEGLNPPFLFLERKADMSWSYLWRLQILKRLNNWAGR